MSKPIDYSKFDHIDADSDSGDDEEKTTVVSASTKTPVQVVAQQSKALTANTSISMIKDESTGRFVFQYNGREVYQWEQTLEDVTIYVRPPPHVSKGNQVNVVIQPGHLKLGLVGTSQLYLDEPTFSKVDLSESTWSLEDGVITIYLVKAHRGMLWEAALKGQTAVELDPLAKEEVKKSLILERFEEENPGFDFRDATFNGGVPDARTFMGGVKYA